MPSPGSGTATRTGARGGGGVAAPDPVARRRGGARLRPTMVPVLVFLVLAVPLVVALVVLARPRWYPLLDLAMTEMRVRDVGAGHPPLVGLLGRFGTGDHPGSHPGPISFWFMWPVWAAAGRSALALRIATVTVHLTAIAAAMGVAWRRGGARMSLGVGALLAVAASTFGAAVFLEPWNPYLPSMWWVVLLLAVWSVLCDDWAMLPVGAFAGTFCAQTHASYAGLVGGMAAFTVVVVAVKAYRSRGDRVTLSRIGSWCAVAAGVAVVMWLPPLVEQFTSTRGNLSIIADDFLHPPFRPIGAGAGIAALLRRMNLFRAFDGLSPGTGPSGSMAPGAALVAAWALSAVVAWRRREQRLNRLNAVIAVALLLAAYSASRIYGFVWFYLLLYGWSLAAAALFATGWAVAVVLRPLWPRAGGAAFSTATVAVAVAALVGFTGVFAWRASDAAPPNAMASRALGEVVGPTTKALRDRMARSPLHGERFVVTWTDTVGLGDQGWGLVNELERAGIPVGVPDIPLYRGGARSHRAVPAGSERAVVHLATGRAIDAWRDLPSAREVAYADPRDAAERAEARRLHADAARRLRRGGRADLVPRLDSQLFLVALAPGLPPGVRRDAQRLIDLGEPVAVFVAPPGTNA